MTSSKGSSSDAVRSTRKRTPTEVAELGVKAMSDDNGACFKMTAPQRERLIGGIARMMVAGCAFTDAELEQWAAGEHTETLAMFMRFDGFDQAQQAMNDIFDDIGEHTPIPHVHGPDDVPPEAAYDPFNCPQCGAHDFGLNRPNCPHCGYTQSPQGKDS